MELDLTVQDIFYAEEEFRQRGCQVNMFGGECVYLEIFNNWDSYCQFLNKVAKCRKIHEKNLSCKLALNLTYIEKYIMQLSLFMKQHGDETMLPFWGSIFIFDLIKWQRKMDKLLVKEINKHNFKLESHETLKWRILRRFILVKQYEDTILYYLLNGKYKFKNRNLILAVNELFAQLDKGFVEKNNK